MTGEFVLPADAKSVSMFDEAYRQRRRDWARRSRKYWGTKPRGSTILTSAFITATIRVFPAVRYRVNPVKHAPRASEKPSVVKYR
jgi:hypothetical protein